MKTRYRIAYAYPTSPNAKELGVYKTGGHYIERQIMLETGCWSVPHIAPTCNSEAFERADDPDLLALLNEHTRK